MIHVDIFQTIESVTGVSEKQIKSRSRVEVIAMSRAIFCVLMRKYTSSTFAQVGSIVNRHHSSVIHVCSRHDSNMTAWADYRGAYYEVCAMMGVDLYKGYEDLSDNELEGELLRLEKEVLKIKRVLIFRKSRQDHGSIKKTIHAPQRQPTSGEAQGAATQRYDGKARRVARGVE